MEKPTNLKNKGTNNQSLSTDKIYLNTIKQHTRDIVIYLDSKLNLLDINPSAEKFYQWKREDVISKNYVALCQKNNLIPFIPNDYHTITFNDAREVRLEIMKEGHLITISYNFTLLKSEFLNTYLIVAQNNSVIQDEVNKVHTYYRNLIAHMPSNVYWFNRNCVALGCNNNVIKLIGLNSLDDFIGMTYEEMSRRAGWTEGQAESFKRDDMKAMESGIPVFNVEEPALYDKKGEPVYYISTRVPLKDDSGNVIGVVGISTDITELKKAEAELKELKEEKENQFYRIIDTVPASIYWKDQSGCYLGCNKYMLDMAGLNHIDEIIGKRDDELAWKNIASKLFEIDKNVILNKATVEVEENPTLANKEEKVFLTTKKPLCSNEGNVIGLIGVSIDITERKKTEIALKEAKEKKEIAEAANKVKTEFLENMRHDIRTPLTGIIGFANIIAEEVQNIKVKEYADNLIASSHSLLDLLNEILEVIKVSSGEIPLLRKKFDLKKRLYEIIKLNQAKAHHKYIDLAFDYDKKIPPYVIGDSTRIHRIVLELVTNALNFTDTGSVKLSAKLAKEKENNLVIKIIVEDTGVGIAPDKQQDIFLQFKRLTPSYEGIYKGAGLGLTIVKQFLDELEGEIYVDSEVSKGTTFTCFIPLKRALIDDEFGSDETIFPIKNTGTLAIKALEVQDIGNKQITSAKSKILLVEDQAVAAKVAATMLSYLDCQVDVASDGKTGIRLAQENNYDLIFMDIGLPDADGYEVTRRIRLYELNKGTHIPIIALTAHVDEENKQRCIDAGMNAVLSKPLDKETAEDILNAFIPYRKSLVGGAETEIPLKERVGILQLEGKVIDREIAKKQLGGNGDMLPELLNMLINGFPEELAKLETAYEKGQWEAIQDIAHKLKGGASYCGTVRLKEACSQLEKSIKHAKQDKELLSQLYKQMLAEIDAVKEAVKNST